MAKVGGTIRNEVGTPILSFLGPAGFSLANVVELLALRTCLREAKHLSLHNLIIEGGATRWALGATKAPWKVAGVVGEILELVNSIRVAFSNIDRSANSEADLLAKEGASRNVLQVIVYPL